jgi:hypothetical protein
MSEPLQPVYHPDADQICAFVEHALPAHEREMMHDHLAVCSECRAVVAHSLPPDEEPVQAPAASRLKPWWFGWRLAWPGGVAVAALALSVFYIHQASVAPKTAAPEQIAAGSVPAPHVPEGQLPASIAKQPARSAPIQAGVASSPASNFEASVESPHNAQTTTNSELKSAPGLQSRNSAVLDKLASPAPAPPAVLPGQSTGMAAGSGGGIGASVVSAPTAVAGAVLPKTTPAQQAEKSGSSSASSSALIGIAPSGRNRQTVAATGAPPAIPTETVNVTSASPAIQTETDKEASVGLIENEAQVNQFILLKHPLPSGLPALSAAMQSRRIVAIDARNGTFLSKDGGKHWKAIHPQWLGRAVRVERVGSVAANRPGLNQSGEPEPASPNTVGAAPLTNAPPPLIVAGRSLAAAPGTSLAGTVTDTTGAVIPGASISVTESATNTVHKISADPAGHYLVGGLAPGSYAVEAKAPGFLDLRVADVAVAANQANVTNLSLKVGAVSETVTVSADSIQPVTATAAQGTSAKAKKPAAHAVSPMTPPVFAITTDNGERWTSTDGVTWNRL